MKIVRYRRLDHVVAHPLTYINVTTGEEGYNEDIVITMCDKRVPNKARRVRDGVPTCVACLGAKDVPFLGKMAS